jgi:xanthine dehydrogenase FAD-binding subunit
MRRDKLKNVRLMSLAKIEALTGIGEDPDGSITIGALTTFTGIAENPLIAKKVPMLKTAALSMGGPQIQNAATIGGNICNGATSADSAPGLFALDAELELRSPGGTRILPVREFYAGPGRVKKAADELLVRIILRIGGMGIWAGEYIKMSTRNAMDISTLGAAALCELAPDGVVKKAAIALGTAGPTPLRCTAAEALLTGRRLTGLLLAKAGEAAKEAASPRSSWRASGEYRLALVEELSARAFRRAFQACGGEIG